MVRPLRALVLFLTTTLFENAVANPAHGPLSLPQAVCATIASAVSGGTNVYYPGSPNYDADIEHYNQRVIQHSACSVEPSSPEDVGDILKIVGSTKTPFAVKSGGHTMNPGFSSTPGVQIALSRFNQVFYDASAQTVDVGPGQIWDDVYAALEPYNVTVVGGRTAGVGVGGLLLGGGLSWKTNQHGLSIDNILAYTLVLPTGRVLNVTKDSYPDLFFGLKGGGNNFGVVVNFVLKAYPQGAVWGGYLVIGPDYIDAVVNATAKFHAEVVDPKAQFHIIFGATVDIPVPVLAEIQIFYDAPCMPEGLFDDFFAVPALMSNVSTQSFVSFFKSFPDAAIPRSLYESIPIQEYTVPMLNAIVNETLSTAAKLLGHPATFIAFLAEPFLPTIYSHAEAIPGYPPSAYPSSRDVVLMPSNVNFIWNTSAADTLDDTMVAAGLRLRETAIALGQTAVDPNNIDAVKYPNYAAYGTPVEKIFGRNLPLLRKIKRKYDPRDVMGLAGGFKL